jgi:glutathione S-transferase
MDNAMQLYFAETLSPRKACAVARYLDADVEFVHVDLGKGQQRSPDYLALNPNGKVPTLVDGDTVVWEANAIMCYLADRAGSALWPKDARQIDVIRWLSWDADHFTRHGGTLYFEHLIKPAFGLGPPDAAVVDEATRDFRRAARVLDAHLANRAFLLGDDLTIADFAVAASLPYAMDARLPLDDSAHIRRWHDRLEQMDAWREPFPRRAA